MPKGEAENAIVSKGEDGVAHSLRKSSQQAADMNLERGGYESRVRYCRRRYLEGENKSGTWNIFGEVPHHEQNH